MYFSLMIRKGDGGRLVQVGGGRYEKHENRVGADFIPDSGKCVYEMQGASIHSLLR
jgi:hypothetical protein